jgi:hypothetical protein
MKSLLIATSLAALVAVPAWAGQASSHDGTYDSMYQYMMVNPHAVQPSASQEQAIDKKVAEEHRRSVASWDGVMGRSDRPQEYLGKDHK